MGADGKLIPAPNGAELQAKLIVWIFAMRVLMIFTSVVSYLINHAISEGHVRQEGSLRLRSAADLAGLDHFDRLDRA